MARFGYFLSCEEFGPHELVRQSGFGPQATALAASIGDGYCTASPDADLVAQFRKDNTGPVQAGMKVCWAPSVDEGLDRAAALWSNELLPGQLAQTLPRPQDFEDAASLVPRDSVGEQVACGRDPERHLAAVQPYLEAGVDEIYVQQIGPDQEAFFEGWSKHVLPALSGR